MSDAETSFGLLTDTDNVCEAVEQAREELDADLRERPARFDYDVFGN